MSEPKLSHPKCYGCGHNFFERPAVPEVGGKPIDGGRCSWCVEEDLNPRAPSTNPWDDPLYWEE